MNHFTRCLFGSTSLGRSIQGIQGPPHIVHDNSNDLRDVATVLPLIIIWKSTDIAYGNGGIYPMAIKLAFLAHSISA